MGVLSYFGIVRRREQQLEPAPHDDFWYGPVPSSTAAGIRVDEDVAMTYSACWAATRLLCGTAGMLPFNLHRSIPGGGSVIVEDHPVHRVIHDLPNDDMTAMMFLSSRMNHQVNRGNCYAEIGRNRLGQAVNLFPIHANRIPCENIKRVNGRLVYYINNDDGTKTEILQENMFHVPSIISDDGVIGRGVVEQARLSIGFGIATEQHGAAYFGNSARPNIVLEGAKFRRPEDAEAFRRMWNEVHGGPANNAKPAILPPDTKLHALPFNAHDSQFLESRQHTIEEIARWYGVPPHLIGHLLRATFSNIEHQGIEFVKYSLMPWLKLWELEVWRKLLTAEEKKTYFAKFNVNALERGDKTSRTAASVQEIFNGLLTINQWAEREDMNPIGPLGDIHWTQQAMVPLEVAAKGPQEMQAVPSDGETNASDDMRQRIEAYGIAVRAGAITPQLNDEEQYRDALGLPPMTDEAKAAWEEDKGIRRPVTLKDAVKQPVPQDNQPGEQDDSEEGEDSGDNDNADDLSATINKLAESIRRSEESQKRVACSLLRDKMAHMLSIEIHNLKHIAEKPNKFDQRVKEFYDKHRITMTRSLMEPLSVVLSISGDTRIPAELVETLADQHVSESMRQMDAIMDCTSDQLLAKVEECVSTWHDERITVVL